MTYAWENKYLVTGDVKGNISIWLDNERLNTHKVHEG